MNMCVLMDEMDRRWDEGREEGRTEGRVEGIGEKTKIVVINMLKRGMPEEDICGLAECSPEFLEEVKSEVFETV